jgi:hypothetical protein
MRRFNQTKEVPWLNTPVGTPWIETGMDDYFQPEDLALADTPFGISLYLLSDEDRAIFEEIE